MSFAREGQPSLAHEFTCGATHFFPGATHVEALARLEHLVESGGRCGVVIGPRGTGKSTVLNLFAKNCRFGGREAITIDVTGLDGVQLLERLAQRLEVSSRARGREIVLWSEINDALSGRALAGRRCVFVVDHFDRGLNESQHLLRRLATQGRSNQAETWVVAFSGRAFPVVPREWRERNDLRIELGPLSEWESREFLRSFLESHGRPQDQFVAVADALISAASGIPSELGRIGELSLLLASDPQLRVSPEILDAVLLELRGLRFSA